MSIDRLTEWVADKAIPRMDLRNIGHDACMKKLAEYEDLEADGRLVKLPCKVGDKYYLIVLNTDACDDCNCKVKGEIFNSCKYHYLNEEIISYATEKECEEHYYEVEEHTAKHINEIIRITNKIGKTVFLTREEAEQKLAELEEAYNG